MLTSVSKIYWGGGAFSGRLDAGCWRGSIVMRWLLGHLGCSARRGLVRGCLY